MQPEKSRRDTVSEPGPDDEHQEIETQDIRASKPSTPAPAASSGPQSSLREAETIAPPAEGASTAKPRSTDAGDHRSAPAEAPEALPASARDGGDGESEGDLNVRCPSCHEAQGVSVEAPLSDLKCGSCGSRFSLTDEMTRSFGAYKKKTALGHFELMEQLGMGAFGSVWKARDKQLDRLVAIKIPRRGSMDEEDIDKFFREARAAAQLKHPNIVSVHEVGREGDTIYIVSDLIQGISLDDWLTGQRLTAREAAELCAVIGDALEHAHAKGVIHRDLKPANVMMDNACQPHLMDFGLAKREKGEVTMTIEGQILGTPAYMSPEQAAGKGHWTDRRSDLYSVGVMLFKMLTDELPYRGNTQSQLFQRQNEDAPDPRTLNKTIPRDLATICLKCLERDANRRYATAAELAEELRRFMRGEPIVARPISRIERTIRWMKRKPAQAVAAGLVAVLAVAGLAAAIQIKLQLDAVAAEKAENDNLIAQLTKEKDDDTATIDQLKGELDVWQGKADSWELWPADAERPPRTAVLSALAPKLEAALKRQASVGLLPRVQRDWAIAELADATGRPEQAARHYELAVESLAKLVDADPGDAAATAALAEAHLRLARLAGDDRDESQRRLRLGFDTLKKLADKPGEVYRERVGLLDTQMRQVVLAGATGEGLKLMAEARRDLELLRNELPSDAYGLYRLVAALANREPLLAGEPPSTATGASATASD